MEARRPEFGVLRSQIGSGLGAAAIAMTILSLVLGALLVKKSAGMKKASSRVESMERPFVPESQKDLS